MRQIANRPARGAGAGAVAGAKNQAESWRLTFMSSRLASTPRSSRLWLTRLRLPLVGGAGADTCRRRRVLKSASACTELAAAQPNSEVPIPFLAGNCFGAWCCQRMPPKLCGCKACSYHTGCQRADTTPTQLPQGAACRHLPPSSRQRAHPVSHLSLLFLGRRGLRLSSGGGRWPQDPSQRPGRPRSRFVGRRTRRAHPGRRAHGCQGHSCPLRGLRELDRGTVFAL